MAKAGSKPRESDSRPPSLPCKVQCTTEWKGLISYSRCLQVIEGESYRTKRSSPSHEEKNFPGRRNSMCKSTEV